MELIARASSVALKMQFEFLVSSHYSIIAYVVLLLAKKCA